MEIQFKEAYAALDAYDVGEMADIRQYGDGHINETYLVETQDKQRYMLQRLNGFVFRDPQQVMRNIEEVTAHLRSRLGEGAGGDIRQVLTLVSTRAGESHVMRDGDLWRMYRYIDRTVSRNEASGPLFYNAARAFGDFFRLLSDYPVDRLHDTIPDFHNTPDRLRKLEAAVAADKCGRAESARTEIEFALARRSDAHSLYAQLEKGRLPLRVTHNDTKLNNVLLDEQTGCGVCVIDLDTVMPGLSAYDFGDAIRYGANTGAEDETDLDKCRLSLELYEAFARGFLEGAGDALTPAEIAALPLGARVITLECGMRFLTDHLCGDEYFKIHRPDHNLQRCRTQFALLADMENKWDEMTAIIRTLTGVAVQ